MKSPRGSLTGTVVLLITFLIAGTSLWPQELRVQDKALIAHGWHLWYEVKMDPENPLNLLVCGTKWDSVTNTPFGFVYASSDGGITWQTALEDRSTGWVTEHSCAFGPNHKAYFISDAAKVVAGNGTSELGATRLFVSTDSGMHWLETLETGWADYSTSAVSAVSQKLYTFFNATVLGQEQDRGWGGANVGLLVFTSDGKRVAGPFYNDAIRGQVYRSAFPKDATPLKSGSVVSLYIASRKTSDGLSEDLGIIRATESQEPFLEATVVAHPSIGTNCFHYSDASLAYDRLKNRLYIAYTDSCKDGMEIVLTSSDDEGKTWAQSAVLMKTSMPSQTPRFPSLAVGSENTLGLLWQEGNRGGPRRWLFSCIRELKLVGPVVELSHDLENYEVSNDSLRTFVAQARRVDMMDGPDSASTTVNVFDDGNVPLRVSGLISRGERIFAVWPSKTSDGMRLKWAGLGPEKLDATQRRGSDVMMPSELDVTREAAVFYIGSQHFDNSTGIFRVCLAVVNRGISPLRVPIKLEAKEVSSSVGAVSVLNATNGVAGVGASWDISESVVGDRIPSSAHSNPFCLSFHVDMPRKGSSQLQEDRLLTLRVKVSASSDSSSGSASH